MDSCFRYIPDMYLNQEELEEKDQEAVDNHNCEMWQQLQDKNYALSLGRRICGYFIGFVLLSCLLVNGSGAVKMNFTVMSVFLFLCFQYHIWLRFICLSVLFCFFEFVLFLCLFVVGVFLSFLLLLMICNTFTCTDVYVCNCPYV